MLNASGTEAGVETAFLGTRSGIIRLTRYTGMETRVAKKFLTPADKDNLFTMDHFPLWYRLAMENPPGRFLYYMPVEDNDNKDKTGASKYVIAVTAVTVSSGGKTAMAGGKLLLSFTLSEMSGSFSQLLEALMHLVASMCTGVFNTHRSVHTGSSSLWGATAKCLTHILLWRGKHSICLVPKRPWLLLSVCSCDNCDVFHIFKGFFSSPVS
ncbi:unnamed protein product [Oncorhynchus mykiss]|uniref:Uncharacterized protein n=1 Tax=Oncorhynchus mykiss TaxID=8022 RepID=A0A060WB63_ONCMY|nr:unnamed protein product [Oncorhynchus mykiss]